MITIFMNSENRKTSDSHRLLHNLSEKVDLKRSLINMLLSQILAYIMHGKVYQSHTKAINLK